MKRIVVGADLRHRLSDGIEPAFLCGPGGGLLALLTPVASYFPPDPEPPPPPPDPNERYYTTQEVLEMLRKLGDTDD